MSKNVTQTIFPWLRANLGKRCLAGLTGQDGPALLAAAQIVVVYSSCDGEARPHALSAFRSMVAVMQPHTRELAYHAIAHVLSWSDRDLIWLEADCPPLERPPSLCAFEPAARQ